MTRKIKTEADVKKAIELYCEGCPISEISRRLGYSREAVRKWLITEGIDTSAHNTSKKFTDHNKKLAVELFLSGQSMQQIQKVVGVNHDTIARYFASIGIDTYKNFRKHNYNFQFFDAIDSEEKAYWLGFLYADGCINERYKRGKISSMVLEVGLTGEDVEHLFKFCDSIGADHELVKKKVAKVNGKEFEIARLTIANTQLCRSLITHGMTSRKTFDVAIPDSIINSPYLPHFLRGLFDGDGSIYVSPDKKKITLSLTSASLELIKQVQSIFTNLGCTAGSIKHDNRGSKAVDYRISGTNNLKKIAEFMYKNAKVYLTRKYEKILPLLRESEEVEGAKTVKSST